MTEKKPGEPDLERLWSILNASSVGEPWAAHAAKRSLVIAFLAEIESRARREGAREALERAAKLVAGHLGMREVANAIRALADQPEAEVKQAPGVADLALMRGEPEVKPEPPLNCNASKAEILENHEKRIAFLEKIACGGPVLYNEKRVLPLAKSPPAPSKAEELLPLGHEFRSDSTSQFCIECSRLEITHRGKRGVE